MGRMIFVISSVLTVWIPGEASGGTWYVGGSVSGSGDGRSWETAFKKIQEGIDAASNGDTVLVAKGTYVENVHFKGKDIVLSSSNPLDPDVVANTIIDGNHAGSVVTFAGTESEACVLSGLTILNGKAEHGGGVYGGRPFEAQTRATIQNSVLSRNSADASGGALYGCAGTIQGNTITGNSAGYGAALASCHGTIRNNRITSNMAQDNGGGLAWCDGIVLNNAIAGNRARYDGGALFRCEGTIDGNRIAGNAAGTGGGLYRCNGTIRNSLVAGNSSRYDGGGLYGCDGAIGSNTIVRNRADRDGGGLAYCRAAIRNCIVWANVCGFSGPQLYDWSQPTYSCIMGWTGGEGNQSTDPRFADADGPDDDPDTHEDNDYRLSPKSPCIDAGKNEDWMTDAVDLGGNPRISYGRLSLTVDMGAYEYRFSVERVGSEPGGGVQVTWPSTPGRSYTVWWRADLTAGEWAIGATLPSQSDLTSWTDAGAAGESRFYRIEMK